MANKRRDLRLLRFVLAFARACYRIGDQKITISSSFMLSIPGPVSFNRYVPHSLTIHNEDLCTCIGDLKWLMMIMTYNYTYYILSTKGLSRVQRVTQKLRQRVTSVKEAGQIAE